MGEINVRISEYDFLIEWDLIFLRIDGEGRWCTYRDEKVFLKRTVGSEIVVLKNKKSYKCDHRQSLLVQEKIINFLNTVYKKLDKVADQINFYGSNASLVLLKDKLHVALAWDIKRYHKQQQKYFNAYPEPVLILPPDRYRNIVLMPAIGCPNAKCSFCVFYKGKNFHVLSEQEFKNHLKKVKSLFGRALGLRKGIFFGSASALSLSQKKLLLYTEKALEEFGDGFRDIAFFCDPDHVPSRKLLDYQELFQAGVSQIIMGVETGNAVLRKKLKKTDDIKNIIKLVNLQKEAGIRCSITIMVGLMQNEQRQSHIKDTVKLIKAMPLDKNDFIYLSPYSQSSDELSCNEEMVIFEEELKEISLAKIAPYRMDLYEYFS